MTISVQQISQELHSLNLGRVTRLLNADAIRVPGTIRFNVEEGPGLGSNFHYSIQQDGKFLSAGGAVLAGAPETLGTGDDILTNFSGTLANAEVSPSSLVIVTTLDDGAATVDVTYTDDGAGNIVDEAGINRGSIDYLTGAFDVTFPFPVDDTITIDGSYSHTEPQVSANGSANVAVPDELSAGAGFEVFGYADADGIVVEVELVANSVGEISTGPGL